MSMTEINHSPDQAAPAAPSKHLMQAPVPNVLATLSHYAAVPLRELNAFMKEQQDSGAVENAVAEVDHFEFVKGWCEAQPEQAARVVMAAIYLASAKTVVQEDAPPEAAADEPEGDSSPE